jgi:hypothetical protein
VSDTDFTAPTTPSEENPQAFGDALQLWNERLYGSRWRQREAPSEQSRDNNGTSHDETLPGSVWPSKLPDFSQLSFEAEPDASRTKHPSGQVARLSLEPLQEWEGYVTDIGEETFHARLVDVTAEDEIEQETAEFEISDLSEDGLAMLREGAVFRWVIGYQRSVGGTKRRVSEIVFRRLPAWTKADLRMAKASAEAIIKDIVWE